MCFLFSNEFIIAWLILEFEINIYRPTKVTDKEMRLCDVVMCGEIFFFLWDNKNWL